MICYNRTAFCEPTSLILLFDIPQVFANLYHVMNDPAYWQEPRTFRPDRFIDQLTGEFIQDERVIPFGVGRRACLGKLLAEQVRYKRKSQKNRNS